MFDALSIGATGMVAQQTNVDTIANNLANASTPAFKKSRVNFSDLMVRSAFATGGASMDAGGLPLDAMRSAGAGVGIGNTSKSFEAGSLTKTESPLDVAIRGDGFLEVQLPDGGRAFMRGGTLKVGLDGQLSNQAGFPLKPGLTIPADTRSISIGSDGRVQASVGDGTRTVEIGQLELVRFANPQGLLAQGDNLYRVSDHSGEPIPGKAAEDGMGSLAQGYLEASNVKMVDEMVNLMIAQRAYEASVKVVQASDEMLGMVNGLRK